MKLYQLPNCGDWVDLTTVTAIKFFPKDKLGKGDIPDRVYIISGGQTFTIECETPQQALGYRDGIAEAVNAAESDQ